MKQFDGPFFRDLRRLTLPYWQSSEQRRSARGLLSLIILLNLFTVYISYRVTEWYNPFWNALQHYNSINAFHQLWVFVLLVTPLVIAAVYQTYFTQMLQIRWRRWLTNRYLNEWLDHGTHYQMQIRTDGTDNPDQRIAEDLDSFTRQSLDLFVGALGSATTLAAFVVMLWTLSRQLPFVLHGHRLIVKGFLVWVAAIYSFCGTVVVAWLGRPLIQLNFDQERFQADFRFSLVRLRENSECIALYGGETREHEHLFSRFRGVFDNFWRIMARTKRLNWWASGYSQAAVIFPVLVSLPAYFAKAIGIGSIMQISSAFGQVQGALSFVVNSYTGLAGWHAVVDRLRYFEQAMQRAKAAHTLERTVAPGDAPRLRLVCLSVGLPNGTLLIQDLTLQLSRGERVLVLGPSGSGKSTLLRTMAGIWPFSEGTITIPSRDSLLALPQRPYLPQGTLRDALLYPTAEATTTDQELLRLLDEVGLSKLGELLHGCVQWSHVLSPGEQQRLAFARVLLLRPDWLLLDEATSALDEASEARLYQTLVQILPRTGVVSAGHRSTLMKYHERRLFLSGTGSWSS